MSGSEFQLIQSYFSEPEQALQSELSRSDVLLGIGDDCAIVAPKSQMNLAFSIDTLVSGVHFPLNTSAAAIAHKALAVNLSDLAAMGAEPAWFTLSLTLPDYDETWLHQFSQSLFALARNNNVHLIGGDTSHGPLSITIQICGYLEQHGGLKRSGAKVGDIVAVTGALGAAAIGLDLALEQNRALYADLSDNDKQFALNALNFPQARIAEGLYLQGIAHSALDISDGLIADLGHILQASNVGAELQLDKLPLATPLVNLEQTLAREKALTGGDDYELCFTLAQEDWSAVKQKHPQFIAIGIITEEKGLRLYTAERQLYHTHSGGYDHFG